MASRVRPSMNLPMLATPAVDNLWRMKTNNRYNRYNQYNHNDMQLACMSA